MCKFNVLVVRKGYPNAVYCGRPSPLGNPFPMGNEADRDYVCDLYQQWFDRRIEAMDEDVLRELRKIWSIGAKEGSVALACFCAPKRCHCDVIKGFFESHMN